MIFISMFAIVTAVCDVSRLSILCFLHTGPANRITIVFLHVSKKKKKRIPAIQVLTLTSCYAFFLTFC